MVLGKAAIVIRHPLEETLYWNQQTVTDKPMAIH